MRITGLRTNYRENPMGCVLDRLHLSWTVTDTNACTDKYTRVIMSENPSFSGLVYDSGKIYRMGQPYLDLDLRLEPEKRYFWKVIVQSDLGELAESDAAWIETGMAGAFHAEWITASEPSEAMPLFSKKISIHGAIRKAMLYCCGYGLYEGYLNEEKIGNEYLMPGYYSYDLLEQYQTYEVTNLLKAGENVLSFLLGNGWYRGRFVFDGGFENLYGSERKLIAELRIQYEDGTIQTVGTDESWEVMESHVFDNGIYDGEVIRMDTTPASLTVKKTWGRKQLAERSNVGLTAAEYIAVKEIITTRSGEVVLDFGEAITGWTELQLPVGEKVAVKLFYGEVMQDGLFYNDNLRTAKAEFEYSGNVQTEWIRPHFTYYGFRYVKVTGLNNIRSEMFRACRLMSDIAVNGSIETSHTKVNTLIQNALRSQKCNFIDIPLDCPQRDERMGWTGDIAVFARTSCYQMHSIAFLDNYLRSLRLEQKFLGGAVPFFVPKPKIAGGKDINPFLVTAGACGWADAATIVPWEMYLHTKDLFILQESYPSMREWVRYIEKRAAVNSIPYLWQNDPQLGDWLALDNGNPDNPIGRTDSGLVASAFFYQSTRLCLRAAVALQKQDDVEELTQLAERIRQAFLATYLSPQGELLTEKTQTAYALIIYFGLYEPEHTEHIRAGMEQALEEYDGHLSTGFIGTRVLCDALSMIGLGKRAYDLLFREEYPSWLHEVNLGATTVWERWNSLDQDGRISGTGMNSLNHYAYGCVVGWIYQYVCGYTWNEENEMVIRPMPDDRLRYVQSGYDCVYGRVEVNWRYSAEDRVIYEIKVPFQAVIQVTFPDGTTQSLRSGVHIIVT